MIGRPQFGRAGCGGWARRLGFAGTFARTRWQAALLLALAAAVSFGLRGTRWEPVVLAQSSRDAYREAFKAWREADPSLESDAARAKAGYSQRTESATAAAARYVAARLAFQRAAIADADQSASWLRSARQVPEPDFAPALDVQTLIATSTELVSSQISTYADDPDPALTSLRQALGRERSALVALSSAIGERQKAVFKTASADLAAEQARTQALQSYQSMRSALSDAATGMSQESLAWADYYRRLSDSVQILAAAAAPPAPTVVTAGNTEVRINNPARKGGASGWDPLESTCRHASLSIL